MTQFPKFPRAILFLGAVGLIGFALLSGPRHGPNAARAQAKPGKKAGGKIDISPPPEDINDLSMEVAALRTLYLLKAESRQFIGIKKRAEASAQKPRKRTEAKVSENYRKVLIPNCAPPSLSRALEDRITELSDQLEELANDEGPELDDTVEVTARARKESPFMLRWFEADMVVKYLAAYGKDFPSPRNLLYETMRLDGKGKKPTPQQWKEIRPFVIREVSWMVGGLDLEKQKRSARKWPSFSTGPMRWTTCS